MNVSTRISQFDTVVAAGAEWVCTAPHWGLLRLSSGAAYILGGEETKELSANCVLLIPPRSAITLLVSTLGPATFSGTVVRVELLSGFLTALERQCLELQAPPLFAPYRLLPDSHPVSMRLADLSEQRCAPNLPGRLAFLEAFTDLFSPLLAAQKSRQMIAEHDAKARLRQLLNQTPESELASLELSDLASRLHCCERHASRLFREVWGHSFRSYVSRL